MKRLFQGLAVMVSVTIVATVALLIPRFRNMASEYGTAEAIQDVKQYLQQHEGRWPESPTELGDKFPVGGKVHVDYSMTSARLIESPALLREAIRPISGKFYTYPHYDKMIADLQATLEETNRSD